MDSQLHLLKRSIVLILHTHLDVAHNVTHLKMLHAVSKITQGD